MIEQVYQYDHVSEISPTAHGHSLALASDRNVAADTPFLEARALAPDVTAKSLRAVSEIVGSRFYVPPSMLAKILREADPVVTVGSSSTRFEGFSACCSAYIRLDLDDEALEIQSRRKGTTNVDFGPDLRGALPTVAKDTELRIGVGAEVVEISTGDQSFLEKKVPLPLRWVKGLADVQVAISAMEPAFSLPKIAAQRFLRGLPRGKNDQLIWVAAVGPTVRVTSRKTAGAVPLRGSHRLRVFEPLIGLADSLDVHLNRANGASSWCLNFGTQRLWLVLNAEPWRGFSGDGGVLSDLAKPDRPGMATVAAELAWQDRIDPTEMSGRIGLGLEEIQTVLGALAAGGAVGFDLANGSYFHRELPFDLARAEVLNPRLKSAHKLFQGGAVQLEEGFAHVKSGDVTHKVTFGENDWSCTCPWFAKNGLQRGPCKHMLAVEMAIDHP